MISRALQSDESLAVARVVDVACRIERETGHRPKALFVPKGFLPMSLGTRMEIYGVLVSVLPWLEGDSILAMEDETRLIDFLGGRVVEADR